MPGTRQLIHNQITDFVALLDSQIKFQKGQMTHNWSRLAFWSWKMGFMVTVYSLLSLMLKPKLPFRNIVFASHMQKRQVNQQENNKSEPVPDWQIYLAQNAWNRFPTAFQQNGIVFQRFPAGCCVNTVRRKMKDLLSLAELSNVCSVFVVFLCLICMVVYIIRYCTHILLSSLWFSRQ